MVGEILGDRYEVQQQLGKKAGRQTLLARDLTTQDPVVLKILRFSSDFEWDDLKLFEREAETLRTLAHPAIPRYLDFFELDSPDLKGFALVQTYIAANSLGEHLRGGRTFGEAEVIQLAQALLAILSYLHDRHPSVIHRDLKPSNILLGDRTGHSVGQVYLVDFGSVQTIAARQGGTITVVGTYGYMPPEQFGGRATPASDLYSLGATLIYLTCGQHPADLPQKELRLQFEQVVRLSPTLMNWLKRMTEPSLERRFSSAQDALQALEQQQLEEEFPLAIGKPVASKVILNQSPDRFEVVVPAKGFASGDIISVPVGLLFTVGGLQGLISLIYNLPAGMGFWGIIFFLALPGLLASGAGISIVASILFSWFGKKRIRIESTKINIVYELFGLKYKLWNSTARHNLEDIESIEYCSASFQDSGSNNLYYKIGPKLTIYAKHDKYQIGGQRVTSRRYYYHFTEEEIEWIAKELGNYLGVPVRRSF